MIPPRTVVFSILLFAITTWAEPPAKPAPKRQVPVVDAAAQTRYRALQSTCKEGIPWLTGTWDYIGQSKVKNFKDTITFEGPRYTETISGGTQAKEEKGTLTGDFRCLHDNRVLLRVAKAQPEGVFGNRSGDDYPCDLLTPVSHIPGQPPERVMLVCFVEWDLRTSMGLDLEYRRRPPK